MAEELGERTELPTGRKLFEARQRGQIVKSADLSAALDLIGSLVLILVLGSGLVSGLAAIMRNLLQDNAAPGARLTTDSIAPTLVWTGWGALRAVGPLLVLLLLVSYLAQFLQVGWLITGQPLEPKLDRLNPVTGLKRLFSLRNLVKTTVNSLKLAVVGGVAFAVIGRDLPQVAALPLLPTAAAVALVGRLVLELAIWLLAVMLAIGLADWSYQRWQHSSDLRMTRQEVKDERRSMDGDPDVKARRLRMARDIAMQRMKQNVPKADVIVTNPTHFSVALQYDQATMRAPRLLAKGADFMAFRIREIAVASGVPIVERPPLARALFFGVEEGQEVPPEHYQAVAEILAYVYRLEGRAA
jgi:flagellar biosynthesis protein FlhB